MINTKKHIYKILTYTGAKYKELEQLDPFINNLLNREDYNQFVDVFGGSGCVGLYFQEKYNIENHYNDKDKHLTNFYKNFFTDEEIVEIENLVKEYKNMTNDEKYKFFFDVRDEKIKFNPTIRYWILTKLCFRGMINDTYDIYPNMRKNKQGVNIMEDRFNIDKDKINQFKNIISKSQITNLDFKECMNIYKDNEKAIVYLDPPYVKRGGVGYSHSIIRGDLEWIKDFMDNCKCKVILNIDYTADTREVIFKEYYRYCYDYKYTAKKYMENVYKDYHCIFMN